MGIELVSTMPQGVHTSTRVALAVPPGIYTPLKAWADMDGRPVASLCLYLIEVAVRQAQLDGIAPKPKRVDIEEEPKEVSTSSNWGLPADRTTVVMKKQEPTDEKTFTKFYEDKLAEAKLQGLIEDVPKTKEEKQARMLSLLAELANV